VPHSSMIRIVSSTNDARCAALRRPSLWLRAEDAPTNVSRSTPFDVPSAAIPAINEHRTIKLLVNHESKLIWDWGNDEDSNLTVASPLVKLTRCGILQQSTGISQ
jgi:hypothetical protein